MRYTFIVILILSLVRGHSQSRINKLSVNSLTNFYSYGEGKGPLNTVVRLGEGLAFKFTTYDTVKKSGMMYELSTMNTTAFYKNIISSGSVLEVNDLHANIAFIFPIVIMYQKRMEQSLGFGICITTLLGRDYYDESGNSLPYNSSILPELKAGKYWSGLFMFDYELSLRFSKRMSYNLGLRFTTSSPVQSPISGFEISQGTGIAFKFGMSYKFK